MIHIYKKTRKKTATIVAVYLFAIHYDVKWLIDIVSDDRDMKLPGEHKTF